MNESFLIGIAVGTLVSLGYSQYQGKLTRPLIIWQLLLFVILLLGSLFWPSRAHAWCDKCWNIPASSQWMYVKSYCQYGEDAERLIQEIKVLTDEYSMNGSDVFMASIGAAMAALPSGAEPRMIFVSVLLANTATYFCKTVECHWKTVHLIDELEYNLYRFKKLGEELLRNKFRCSECSRIYQQIYYFGSSTIYFNEYPPCCFDEEGCIIDYEEPQN